MSCTASSCAFTYLIVFFFFAKASQGGFYQGITLSTKEIAVSTKKALTNGAPPKKTATPNHHPQNAFYKKGRSSPQSFLKRQCAYLVSEGIQC